MPRILGIDYGSKRSGLAVTDPEQLIVNGLTSVATPELVSFIENYITREAVVRIVIGFPRHKDGKPTDLAKGIRSLKKELNGMFPDIEVVFHDEGYSTVTAREILIKSGMPRMKRRSKDTLNKVSAVVILQDYLQHI